MINFSETFITPEMMLAECKLDAADKVMSPVDMTNTIAESYVASDLLTVPAFQAGSPIGSLLLCLTMRYGRKSRKHPAMQKPLPKLMECIARMPLRSHR